MDDIQTGLEARKTIEYKAPVCRLVMRGRRRSPSGENIYGSTKSSFEFVVGNLVYYLSGLLKLRIVHVALAKSGITHLLLTVRRFVTRNILGERQRSLDESNCPIIIAQLKLDAGEVRQRCWIIWG